MRTIAFLTTGVLLSSLGNAAPLQPGDLRVEYLANPLGVDMPAPRLSWQFASEERGKLQTARQVLVSTELETLEPGLAQLWDSGRVEDGASVHVPYAGAPLPPSTRCFWKVRVWDEQGEAGPWSEPAMFATGLFGEDDWRAAWIAAPKPAEADAPPVIDFGGAQWIWAESDRELDRIEPGGRFFRAYFVLPEDDPVQRARFVMAADDNAMAHVNGLQAIRCKSPDTGWRADIEQKVRPGRNSIAIQANNAGRGPAGIVLRLVVTLQSGREVTLETNGDWKSAAHAPGDWKALDYDDSGWGAPRVLGEMGMAPWGKLAPPPDGPTQPGASPLFRAEFEAGKTVRYALAHICGLGYHELRLNGEKVGDHQLDPAFTRYDKRALYVTHDVTGLVREGTNAVGVMLGHGWYDMHARAEWDFDQAPWRARPRLRFQLHIVYEDGTEEHVTSGPGWRTAPGPITFDCIRNGEHYDARLERPGWDQPGHADADWEPAAMAEAPAGALRAQLVQPMRVTDEFAPKSNTEPRPGVHVFDLGQNIAGFARLRVEGPAGDTVKLTYGERLLDDGTIDPQLGCYLYSGEFQVDRYTLRGGGVEVWQPRFVFHGFQYVQVEGLPEPPSPETVTGLAVHTDFPRTGHFASSNPLYGQIQHATLWSYRNNFAGYPMDCPQREKNGWTGDAHLAAELGLYNFESAPAYTKWLQDFADEQRDAGDYAAIIPTSGWGYDIGPSWDCAYVLIPWYLYVYRGDTRVLEAHYPNLQRYLEFLGSKSRDYIVSYGLGDWVPADSQTEAAITSTAYYYVDARVLARMAGVLGKTDDARKYEALADNIRAAFNARFRDEVTGTYGKGTQTPLACALYQGLAEGTQPATLLDAVPRALDGDTAAVATLLAEAVRARDNHLDCGILGTKYLLHALTDHGHPELAWAVTNQTTRPSWGHWIARGATTLWEDWDGSFSLNHVMFGDISAWFYRVLAGIRPDPGAPGFKHIVFVPHLLGDLEWVRASAPTPHGPVESAWKRGENAVEFTFRIPANTRATVYLPCSGDAAITESGKPAAESDGVEPGGTPAAGRAAFRLESGLYTFRVPLH